jgi:hypothetical protein
LRGGVYLERLIFNRGDENANLRASITVIVIVVPTISQLIITVATGNTVGHTQRLVCCCTSVCTNEPFGTVLCSLAIQYDLLYVCTHNI